MKILVFISVITLPLLLSSMLLSINPRDVIAIDDALGGYGGVASSRAKCWSHFEHSKDNSFLQCKTCIYVEGKKKGLFYDGWCYFTQ